MVTRLVSIIASLNSGLNKFLRTRPNTKVSGSRDRILGLEKVSRLGLMDQCMRVGGEKIKQMERDALFMLMVMYMMVRGSTIRLMVMVSIVI